MWNFVIEHFTGPVSWVDEGTLLSVIVGGGFAWGQWRQSCRVRRAEHLNVILSRYDTQVTSIHFYKLINNTTYGGTDGDLFYLGGLRFRDVMEGNGRVIVSEKDIDSMLLMFHKSAMNSRMKQSAILSSRFSVTRFGGHWRIGRSSNTCMTMPSIAHSTKSPSPTVP